MAYNKIKLEHKQSIINKHNQIIDILKILKQNIYYT